MMLPVGIELGLSPALLVGLMAATYAYFFILIIHQILQR